MKFRVCIFIIYCVFVVSTGFSQSWKQYPYTPEGSLISFPADEGHHNGENVEWWYTSGHLTGSSTGNKYSYILSYFYYPALGYDGFRIMNLSNDDTGEFFTETAPLRYDILAEDSLNIKAIISQDITETWTNQTDLNGQIIPFNYSISAESENGSLNLEYEGLKSPLILAENGLFDIGGFSYTYYFSLTGSSVSGTINFNGLIEEVTGTSWIDHQYGNFNPLTAEDYEWFSIQLSNDMDLNIWNLFTAARIIPDLESFRHMSVYVDSLTQYTTKDFNIERLKYVYMPDSVNCYSQKWRLTSPINNIDLVITTLHNYSEVHLPFRFYEGSTTVTGTVNGSPVTGTGFAELLHSYEDPDVIMENPSGGYWNANTIIAWQVVNPDDGRPLFYDLECSIDNKQTFIPVAQDLTDTLFYWTDPTIPSGSSCWFRVTSHSIDSTLFNTAISENASSYFPNLTSIDDSKNRILKNELINIYPNPAEELISIELDDHHPFLHCNIMDVYGRICYQKYFTGGHKLEIDIHDYPAGIYFVGLFTKDNKTVSKVIIQ